jgi:hypothetical protein
MGTIDARSRNAAHRCRSEQEAHAMSTVPATRPTRSLWIWPAAVLIGVSLSASLGLTSRDFGMVWDEGHTVRRVRQLDDWFARLLNPRPGRSWIEAFSETTLHRSWPFSREEPDGHPPFYAELGLAGHRLTRDWVDPLTSYRFGTIFLCGVTAAALWLHLTRRFGTPAGIVGSICPFLMPRSFALAHYAHYDMIVSCLWVLAQIAFVKALESSRWRVVFGLLLGLAAGTKFTGWFAVFPALFWVLLMEAPRWVRGRDGRSLPPGARSLLTAAPVAIATLYVIQPPWWFHPINGPWRFFVSNLTRSKTQPISILYMGQVYSFSLPWHNTIVLTAICVPVVILALGAIGIFACARRWRMTPWMMIWPLSWVVLMIVRALPNAPGHDGLRLFMPSVMSLGVLAGIGAWSLLARRSATVRKACGVLVLALVCVEPVHGFLTIYPYMSSYYNVLIGGLRGAERHGFEVTYYWDTLGTEFQDWVRENSEAAPLDLNFPVGLVNVPYMREWGMLPPASRVPIVPFDPVDLPYYVLQRRRGGYKPYDWWLERQGRPCFIIQRQGVDLLRVYPFEESFRAYRAMSAIPNSPNPNP